MTKYKKAILLQGGVESEKRILHIKGDHMIMKKFINDRRNLTSEMLEGLAAANKDILILGKQRMIINRKLADARRVTVVAQGGSGNEPAVSGFVGEGMVDISVVGDIFAAPDPQACNDKSRSGWRSPELFRRPAAGAAFKINRCNCL